MSSVTSFLSSCLFHKSAELTFTYILLVRTGHWSLNHNVQNLVLSEINIFVYFYLFGTMINSTDLYASFGFSTQPVGHTPRPVLWGNLSVEWH
jgi:hypothetical protein